MKLGVYSLVTPDYTTEECATALGEVGYTGVEWTLDYKDAVWDGESKWHISTDNLEASAAVAREAAESNGLEAVSLGTVIDCFDLEGVRTAMKAANLIGAPMIRVDSPRYDGSTHFDELFSRGRQAYVEVEALARDAGVKAVVELHPNYITASASGSRRLLDGLDPQWLGAIFDPGNMIREGFENWRMAIQILGPYLAHVHVKNMAWLRDQEGDWQTVGVALAEGIVDWRAVIEELKAVGYDGYLSLEDLRGGYARRPVGITSRQKLDEGFAFL